MMKLSKKVEYAILAMQYMAMNPGELINAKQIAEDNNLSFEFLSKSLQILNRKGLVNSVQGVRGGYSLAKPPEKITVADVIKAVEQSSALVECTVNSDNSESDCQRVEFCILKNPMMHLQNKINSILRSTSILELAKLAYLPKSNKNNYLNIQNIKIMNNKNKVLV